MGTDIHMYVEAREPGGPWRKVGKIWDNPRYEKDGTGYFSDPRFEKTDEAYDGRNYDLFAVLANVRNGVGFAGVELGEPKPVIAEPRGFPDDMSTELLIAEDAPYDENGPNFGEHDFSWLTLKELLDFDWDQDTRTCGVVKLAEYQKLGPNKRPDGYCGSVSGGGAVTISASEADTEPNLSETYGGGNIYVKTWWREPLREAVGSRFFDETLPRLQKLGDPENVRIVFGFDS